MAPSAFSFMAPPGCPLCQVHVKELVLSSHVFFASVSSFSFHNFQHSTRERSGDVVALLHFSDSAGDSNC